MPKKNMTPEERKAFGEKMKAAREAKKNQQPEQPKEDIQTDVNVQELLRRIEELEANKRESEKQTPEVTAQGMVGVFTKYITDPANYPDPVERLSQEPRLARFAFPENYELNFHVETSSYETKTGINTEEPRFHLDLIGKVFDDAGVATNKRYIMRRLVFHEDPQAALVIARDNNMEVDKSDERTFLNEMRYLRMRDWIMDFFFPKPATSTGSKREEVIGNQLVEVYEISSETSQEIPFNDLRNPR